MSKVDVSEIQGPLTELMVQLSGPKADEVLNNLKMMLKGVVKKLLAYVGNIALGSIETFDASRKFTKDNTKVKFHGFSSNFEKNFGGKVEDGIAAETIAVYRLEQSARDPEIMAELGPEKRVINLAQFYEVLARNTSGWFVAYIEDVNGIVWAVRADWDAGYGWDVDDYSVDGPGTWDAGDQVLSRK